MYFQGRIAVYHRSCLASRRTVSTTLPGLSALDDVSYGSRNRSSFEVFRVDANDGDISFRDLVARSIIHDFEIVTNCLLTLELGRQPHPDRVAIADWFGKLGEDFDPRHPYVVCLEQLLTGLSSRTK